MEIGIFVVKFGEGRIKLKKKGLGSEITGLG